MKTDERYPIERYIMTKNDCYKANKRRIPTGIQVHSVGCKGTTRDRWRRWNVSGLKKCANAIIDLNGIMQTLDWDVRPWLSGSGQNGNANDWCVGFEICEPSVANDTPEAAAYLYGCVRYLCAELCREYGIRPENIKCHCELHREGVASNHADVNHWWGKTGTSWEPYTMATLRRDVADDLGIPREVKHLTGILRRGSRGDEVLQLQEWLNEFGYNCGAADGIYGSNTEAAVKAFQAIHALKADGICGPQTWQKLLEQLEPEADPEPDEPEAEPPSVTPDADPDSAECGVRSAELIAMMKRLEDLKTGIDDAIAQLQSWMDDQC